MKLAIADSKKDASGTGIITDMSGYDALLVSPMDVHVYFLNLPELNQAHYKGAITFQLRTLYPGDPAETVFDYRTVNKTKRGPDSQTAVFVTERAVLETYKTKNVPLLSGLAFLTAAAEKSTGTVKAVFLLTKNWFEAAAFRDQELVKYTSGYITGSKTAQVLAAFCSEFENEPLSIQLISRSAEQNRCREYGMELEGISETLSYLKLEEMADSLKLSRTEIFSARKKNNRINHKLVIAVIILLVLCTSYITLRVLTSRTEKQLTEVKAYYEKKMALNRKADLLDQEIYRLAEMNGSGSINPAYNMYEIISEIHGALSGAWVKSLVIRENSFNIEAEGADSLKVLQLLRESSAFSNITLHQASPSKIRGEQFSISGSISYDKK
ncbi:hypothetical protein K7I13_11275 [Brucepastera parasyntrophica]|uniref:hypothetical protein n=1 Tax=Brucepastera parasyntrophica TaxID=2880008 RepID=UPI00210CCE06|nr:hypothetical protein [Brucepastera parasyntrophica]ULQ59084.1 hypothetical protein K7I13_11275 [Brucepastera parasyntrophica]